MLWRLTKSSEGEGEGNCDDSSGDGGAKQQQQQQQQQRGGSGNAQPVLLDWGWALRMTPPELKGLRSFASAMGDMDLSGAAAGLKAMGYANNQDERAPERSVAFFGYLFRPTGGREAAAKERKAFFAERKKEKAADEAAGVREKGGRKIEAIPKSFMAVTRIFGLLRGLCTSHGAHVDLLEAMASHARLAIMADGDAGGNEENEEGE